MSDVLKKHIKYINSLKIPRANKNKLINLLRCKYENLVMKIRIDDEYWIIFFKDLGFTKIPCKNVYDDEECTVLLKSDFLDLKEYMDFVEFDD